MPINERRPKRIRFEEVDISIYPILFFTYILFCSSSLSDCDSDTDLNLSRKLLSWIRSNRFSETDDSTSSAEKSCSRNFTGFTPKQCVVNIQRLSAATLALYASKASSEDPEDSSSKLAKEIDFLTDLSNLEHSKKRNGEFKHRRKAKKFKPQEGRLNSSESSSSDSGTESSASELEDTCMIEAPALLEDLEYEILKNLSGLSEESEDERESSSETEDGTCKKGGKNKLRSVSKCEKRRKLAEWRKDSLLRGKLISSDSESDSDSDFKKIRRSKKRQKALISDDEDSVVARY